MNIVLLKISVVSILLFSLTLSLAYVWKLSYPLDEQILNEPGVFQTEAVNELPSKSCVVLQFISYNDFISGEDTVFSTNRALAVENNCYFLGIYQHISSCFHWRKGMVHRSFCIIQEILNFMQNLKGSPVLDIIISFHYGNETIDGDFIATSILTASDIPKEPFPFESNKLKLADVTVFEDRKVQIWRINPNEKKRLLLKNIICQLWDSVFDVDNGFTFNITEDIDKPPSMDYFEFFATNTLKLEKKIESSVGLKDGVLFHLEKPPSKSIIANVLLQGNTLNNCLKASIPNYHYLYDILLRESSPNQRHGSIVGHSEKLGDLICNVKIRFNYARDSCLMREESYNYPMMIEPKFGCKRSSEKQLKSAFLILFTESPRRASKFPKTLKALSSALAKAMDANPEVDLVMLFQNESEWISKANFDELMKSLDKVKSSLKHPEKFKKISNTSLKPSNLSPDLLEFTTKTYNCCGWTEYIKLAAWSMVEYDTLMVIDADIFFNNEGVFQDLNQCYDDYLFLNSFDARVGLQGGLYWIRPNLEIYNHMKELIAVPNLFKPYTGWNFTGPYFSPIRAEPVRIIQKKGMYSFAQDTPQGFLFYYFMAQKYLEIKDKLLLFPLKVAQVEPCVYNYRKSTGACASFGGLDFLCGHSIARALGSHSTTINVEAAHNSRRKSIQLKEFALLQRLLKG